jgi:hypothetical protein
LHQTQAARSAAAAALLPILRRQASMMKPTSNVTNESAQSSDTPRDEAEHTDVASPLDPLCPDSPSGPWSEDATPCELPSSFNSSMTLTQGQATCLEELALQRQCALSAVEQNTHGPRGLRAVLPEASMAAVRLEACRAAEAQYGVNCSVAATPARPCDVARRCYVARGSADLPPTPLRTMSMPERTLSSPCDLVQTHSLHATQAASQEVKVSLPSFPGMPPALPVPQAGPCTTADGRDAQGRCVDAGAYKRFYGFWPGREARLTFAEWQRELQPPYRPFKRAQRPPKPEPMVMSPTRAASELQGLRLGVPKAASADTAMCQKERSWLHLGCTQDSARCMHSNLECSKQGSLTLPFIWGQLPQQSEECMQFDDAASLACHSRQGRGDTSSETMCALDCTSSLRHS